MERKKGFLKALSLAILSVFLLTSLVYGDSTMRSARITDVTGDVKIRKAGGEKLFPAVEGMGLAQGDCVISGKNGTVKLTMDEDKEVRIANNTQLFISQLIKTAAEAGEKTSLSLLSGKVLITINKKLSSDSKFDIKTPTAVMGVRGTQWYTLIRSGYTDVGVITGTVLVTSASTGATSSLPPMTSAQISIEAPAIPVQPLEIKNIDLFTLKGIQDTGTLKGTDLQNQLDKTIEEKQQIEDTTPPEPILEDEEYMFDPEYLIYEEDGVDYGDPGDIDMENP